MQNDYGQQSKDLGDLDNCSPIVLYFQALSGKGGGAEKQLILLAGSLVAYGYNVHIISWDEQEAESFYAMPSGAVWHKLGFKSGVLDKFRRLRRLCQVLRRFHIRTFIGFVMTNNKVVILACLIAGVKIIAAERNGPEMYRIKNSFIGRWMNYISLLACKKISVQFEEFTDGYPAFLHSKIVTVPNPVLQVHDHAHPGKPGKRTYQILYIGRFDRIQKQPTMLLAAFSKISGTFKNWNLTMVGDGPELEILKAQITEFGLEGRVSLTSSCEIVSHFYQTVDLFVIPSLWEGSPNALAEAMAHGLPSVGFDVDGVRQLIRHGSTGWIVPEINIDALADTLSLALKSKADFRKIGEAAKAATLQYDKDRSHTQWHRLIMSLGEKRAR